MSVGFGVYCECDGQESDPGCPIPPHVQCLSDPP